jgi:hypothetical protein
VVDALREYLTSFTVPAPEASGTAELGTVMITIEAA